MPRLQLFRTGGRVLRGLTISAACALTAGAACAAPTAVIQTLVSPGQAPFVLHVHGMNSTLGVGNELTASYEWDFGDQAGEFNTINGWNAAHLYEQPGAYTITLKVTNQLGESHMSQITVTIAEAARSFVYVSPSGSDSNNGSSPQSPIKTFAKAATMLGNNKAILFQRNGTFDTTSTMTITQQNVLVGAYGTGAAPVIRYTASTQYATMIKTTSGAKDVVIENITFDSPFTPTNMIVRATEPKGTNITVRSCQFGNVSYAMNTGGGGSNGLLSMNNTAGLIGAYYCWAEGSNHVHLGNTVADSAYEHIIRTGGQSRMLIAHNNFTNTNKTTIWLMLGDHAYIANNTLNEGRFQTGPNFATSAPGERFRWVVFENNRIINDGVILMAGSEDMVLRNNYIQYNGGETFSIWGYDANWDRTCKNISLCNNTATNDSTQYGRFLKLGNDAQYITVANNLYCAPSLNPPWGAANVKSEDSSLGTHSFHHNLWATPDSGNQPHTMPSGGITTTQWDAFGETSNESYRAFTSSDLDANLMPQFDATYATPASGVFTDMYGYQRPSGAEWTAGAVEQNPADPGGGAPLDVNGDGIVDTDDLLAVVQAWGTCPNPANCPADVDGNGIVNIDDLTNVIGGWG